MNKTQKLVLAALLTALVTVATIAFQVPVPATKGYINLGDTVIFLAALLLGPRYGAIAGGVGSALADLLSPYAAWAPFTLVIKGLEGFIVGYVLYRLASAKGSSRFKDSGNGTGRPVDGGGIFHGGDFPIRPSGGPGGTAGQFVPGAGQRGPGIAGCGSVGKGEGNKKPK
jgi:hypothetical protein